MYRSHLYSVPSVFSCTYTRLDGDNKVKNYLCYLIPHTTKSLIFSNALLFIPAIITCMELFVCPHNHESSLTTIRLVCITKVFQEYATFMMIILVWRKHWFFGGYFSHIDWHAYSLAHTDNHKRCWWSCNRLQYLKLCASSLFFSSLSWHLVALEEMDWLSSVMILSRIQCASCICMYCRTFLRLEKLWFGI